MYLLHRSDQQTAHPVKTDNIRKLPPIQLQHQFFSFLEILLADAVVWQ